MLNLTTVEKQQLADALFVNYQPENREYRLNFVYDNCSTRPRDKNSVGNWDKVVYDYVSEPQTFRNWVGTSHR